MYEGLFLLKENENIPAYPSQSSVLSHFTLVSQLAGPLRRGDIVEGGRQMPPSVLSAVRSGWPRLLPHRVGMVVFLNMPAGAQAVP